MAQPANMAAAAPRQRLHLVDLWRGGALLAMIVYHFAWDLSYYGLIATDLTTHPFWVTLQRSILSSFLLLVGIGLVLAHGRGMRWPAFWRRLAAIAAAALAVTAGTFWMFPDYFVYFGILHAIALFSLLALPFLRLPAAVVLAAAGLFLVPPLLWSAPQFAARPLAWIGFWSVLPETTDIVPLFPWFGVVLIGIAGARLALATPLAARLALWQPPGPVARLL
ncbi:heparan-alpha-glucosaminide N-acetyltransferase, partial [Devosia sp.]|uniref:heparan-alpha-glucosaminide N-acetyltransferase n=1 Tax=Devosia sp. TaxID=1871048 RepID=UPI002F02D05A